MSGIRRVLLGALLALCTSIVVAIGLTDPFARATENGRQASGEPSLLGRATGLVSPRVGPADGGGFDGLVATLAASLGERRPVEPRLSGFTAHAPCEDPPDAPDDLVPLARCSPMPAPGSPEHRALTRVSRGLLTVPEDGPTAAHLHARGLWYLLWHGQDGATDRAVAALENAAALSPVSDDPFRARVLSDLSAAYLVRAAVLDRPLDLIQALDAADRALDAAPDLPEALFNHALARESLHLHRAALESWEAFLREDVSTPWADEARSRHRGLDRPSLADRWELERPHLEAAAHTGTDQDLTALVGSFPHQARDWVQVEGLGAWAESTLAGRLDDASSALRAAERVARTLEGLRQGSMGTDAIAAIRRTTDRQRLSLAEGHRAFVKALEHKKRHDPTSADELFRQAEDRLAQGGSVLAAWAGYHQAITLYFEEPATAMALLEEMRKALPTDRYPVLLGQIDWMLGLTELTRGHPAAAVPHYRSGIAIFRSISHPDAGTLSAYLAAAQESLGLETVAWDNQLRALALLGDGGRPDRLYNVLFTIIDSLLRREHVRLADDFAPDLLDSAQRWERPGPIADAYLTRARIHLAFGAVAAAVADLGEASAHAESMPPGPQKQRLLADLDRVRGDALIASDPAEAVRTLSSAARTYRASGHTVRLLETFTTRARAHLEMGDARASEQDLLRALRGHEAQRSEIDSPEIRTRRFEAAQPAFDSMVRLQLEDLDAPWTALRHADRARASDLLDSPFAPAPLPEDDRDLLEGLPAHLTVVEYAVLPDHLVVWTLRRDRSRVTVHPMNRRTLERRVDRVRSAIESGLPPDTIHGLTAPLLDDLLGPALEVTPAGEPLVLVLDRILHRLPFPALWSEAENRYLIERNPLSRAPTLRHGLDTRHRTASSWTGGTALAVGTSAFDSHRFAELAPLPHAEEEARRVAGRYPRSRLLLGREASSGAVLEGLRTATIVHVAAHAVSRASTTDSPALVLAPEDEEDSDGTLSRHTLTGLSLPECRLVFLSSCETIDPLSGIFRGGLSGLVHAFLAAGSESVVATLWEVDDRGSLPLVDAFHADTSRGHDAADALRHAQIALLGHPDPDRSHPKEWAGFTVVRRTSPPEPPTGTFTDFTEETP